MCKANVLVLIGRLRWPQARLVGQPGSFQAELHEKLHTDDMHRAQDDAALQQVLLLNRCPPQVVNVNVVSVGYGLHA